MTKMRANKKGGASTPNDLAPDPSTEYGRLVSGISGLLAQARRSAARSVNALLTATYWEIGRRIVEYEQRGRPRAEYGERLLIRLAIDLTSKLGRGFSRANLQQMRLFYSGWQICQTPSGKFEAQAKYQTLSGKSGKEIPQMASANLRAQEICPTALGKSVSRKRQTPFAKSAPLHVSIPTLVQSGLMPTDVFPLGWSQYVRLMAVENPQARAFYESEAIRGGWSVRQLDRQISTQFYERAVRSKRPAALVARGQQMQPQDAISVEEEVRDPYLLEFLNLKDEFGESHLEEALIRHLEWFLLEMGAGFTFVARQKRIRDGWHPHPSFCLQIPDKLARRRDLAT